jgi:hypothetical protein
MPISMIRKEIFSLIKIKACIASERARGLNISCRAQSYAHA